MYQLYVSQLCSIRNCTSWCVCQIPIPCQYTRKCTNVGWIIDWYDVCQIGRDYLILFRIIWIDLIQVGVDVIQIDAIQNYRIFAPNFFNFEIILALSIFENYVASRVFNFTFFCAMIQHTPVGKIRRPSDWVKYVEAPLPGPGNMWAYASHGSRWVHTDDIISIPT